MARRSGAPAAYAKPQKQGWDDKKTFIDLRRAVADEQEIREWEQGAGLKPGDFRQ